jgi:hypothetical protein
MIVLPKLEKLCETLPIEGAVRIELVEGIPIFRPKSSSSKSKVSVRILPCFRTMAVRRVYDRICSGS